VHSINVLGFKGTAKLDFLFDSFIYVILSNSSIV